MEQVWWEEIRSVAMLVHIGDMKDRCTLLRLSNDAVSVAARKALIPVCSSHFSGSFKVIVSGNSMLVSGSISSIMIRPRACKSFRSIYLFRVLLLIMLSPMFATVAHVSYVSCVLGLPALPILMWGLELRL